MMMQSASQDDHAADQLLADRRSHFAKAS